MNNFKENMGHGPCWCSRHVHKMSMYCAGNYVISVASLLAANDGSMAWAISSERWDLSAKTGSSSEFYFISLFIILSCLAHRLIAAHPISLGPTLQTHYCKTENTSVKLRCWHRVLGKPPLEGRCSKGKCLCLDVVDLNLQMPEIYYL